MALEDVEPVEAVAVAVAGGSFAVLLALWFVRTVKGASEGPLGEKTVDGEEADRLKALRLKIYDGAVSFLNTEYKWLAVFVAVVGVALALILIDAEDCDGCNMFGFYTLICFIVGALLSGAAGYGGMLIATEANSRTAIACKEGLSEGLSIAFTSGAVMSNVVVGLGILGLSVLYLIFEDNMYTWSYLSGFGFGASSIALFARVGGGCFTKAADVGADLVGKVERGMPEDDPRNPAVIADNVGDNVGDVAGMGADLFESYVGSIIATATLAEESFGTARVMNGIALPFWIAGFGIIASAVGIFVVKMRKLDSERATLDTLLNTINLGILVSIVIVVIMSIVSCVVLFESPDSWRFFGCIIIGLVAGFVIGQFTEYCTSYEKAPTRDISNASTFGGAPVIIKGLGVGMISVVVPTLVMAVTILSCNELAERATDREDGGLYGVALAAVGMLSTLGVTLATDAYGPVADNAGGLAEMAGLPDNIRSRTDKLDSLGNTTAATGKGFAIGSAVLTSVGLIAAFMNKSGLRDIAVDLKEPNVLTGVLIGSMLPFIFAALTMLSVDKSARSIIHEVRRQFALAPALFEEGVNPLMTVTLDDGEVLPNSDSCVAIATTSAIQEMVLPGGLAVFSPVIIGFLLGPKGLAGMLGGSLTAGFMLALTMSNAGGAWDNAKKWVEKCASEGQEGDYEEYGLKKASGYKGTKTGDAREADIARLLNIYKEKHAAVVTGDTVGDPFKDTSGPALNILIKLMSVVSLVIAPALKRVNEPDGFDSGSDGWWIAVIVAAVLGIGCYILLSLFEKSNAKRAKLADELAARRAATATAAAKPAATEPKEESKPAAPADGSDDEAAVGDVAVVMASARSDDA